MNMDKIISDKIISDNEETLVHQSRSFAVPILKMETRFKLPIMTQYNLCKIVDTIEDSIELEADEKIALINEVCGELENHRFSSHVLKEMLKITPQNESYVFKNYASIIALFNQLSADEQQLGIKYLNEMTLGMTKFVKKDIDTPSDLNQYCYYVAGTVGLYLTHLLEQLSGELDNKRLTDMQHNGVHFGLFLQKLNIIRDYRSDSMIRHRHFWPNEYFKNKKSLTHVLDLMCEETISYDIAPAIRYCQSIPSGVDDFDFFIRYILKSGIKYMGMLRGNFMIFFLDKVKLSRPFINGLYDDVANLSKQDFHDEMVMEHSLLKEAFNKDINRMNTYKQNA